MEKNNRVSAVTATSLITINVPYKLPAPMRCHRHRGSHRADNRCSAGGPSETACPAILRRVPPIAIPRSGARLLALSKAERERDFKSAQRCEGTRRFVEEKSVGNQTARRFGRGAFR